ncbi:hypothetical protein [Puniceibacterium sediminis]|uniref:Uncharacterized protein n=1 Tax=Puniceibacterium sediminis TaxID=1608407 RepID=A0A238WWT5_9RHOB|nr:hypothetical protein [Puniceibacterium sediminis]SNR50059.1 hypothetical protein SAMN06265370_107125 [Puniceibacterium sediminis]
MKLLPRLSLALFLIALSFALLGPMAEAAPSCDGAMCHGCAHDDPCPDDMAKECGLCFGLVTLPRAEMVFDSAFAESSALAPLRNGRRNEDAPTGQDPPPPRG